MNTKTIFNNVVKYLRKKGYDEIEENVYQKEIEDFGVYVEIALIYDKYIEISYGNQIKYFTVFSSDDDDYNLKFNEQMILDIVSATEDIAYIYDRCIDRKINDIFNRKLKR